MSEAIQADRHDAAKDVIEVEEYEVDSQASGAQEEKSRVASQGSWDQMLALAALGLALIGQFFFTNIRGNLLDGLLFFTAAMLLFLILVGRSEPTSGDEALSPPWYQQALDRLRSEPVQAALVILSFALAYTTVRLLKAKPGYGNYWDVFAMWVLSGLCYLAAFVRPRRFDLLSWLRSHRLELSVVITLTMIAAGLRFVALGDIPPVVSGDEGNIGWLGLDVLKGKFANMMATTFGHGTMYIFAIAGSMKVFGTDAMGLRMTSAIGGALTVPALYILARRMFNVRVAVIAAALLAVSHFHIHFSRIIVAGSIQDALFATIAFYFFFTGLEERSPVRFVLSAVVIGVHLYIYMGARLVILMLPVYVLTLLVKDRELVRENRSNLLIFAGALAVVSAPMAMWAVEHWNEFMARANQIGIIQSGWLTNEALKTGESRLQIFSKLLVQAFLTVNYFPAKGFYNSPLPMLDFLSGAIFMLGYAYSLYHVADRRHLLLQGWFWSGLLVGGALVVETANAAYRVMIVFPAVCMFVALGWDKLIEFGVKPGSARRITRIGLIGVFIAFLSVLNLKAYFLDYASACRYEDWGTRFSSYMGEYLSELGPEYKAYLLGAPRVYYGIHKSVDFWRGHDTPVVDVEETLTGRPDFVDSDSRLVFVSIPERQKELGLIERYIPGGEELRKYDCGELIMLIYRVDGAQQGDPPDG